MRDFFDITKATSDFTNWVTSWPRPLEAGIEAISSACCATNLAIFVFQPDREIFSDRYSPDTGFERIQSACPHNSSELKFACDLLDQAAPENFIRQVTNSGDTRLLMRLSDQDANVSIILVLQTSIAVSDSQAIETYLRLTIPQYVHLATDKHKRRSVLSLAQEALEAIDDGVVVYDDDDRLVLHNNRYKELFPSIADTLRNGITYETLLREQARNNPLHGQPDELEKWVNARKSNLHKDRYQEEQQFASGQTVRLTNYKLKSGGTVSIRNDITELVDARKKAENSELLFRTLLEGAPVALAVTSKERILYANSIMHLLLGADEGSLIGTDTRSFFFNDQDHDRVVSQLLDADMLMGHVTTIRKVNGKPIIGSLTGSHIIYEGKQALFYSLIDITETIQNREALKRSEKQKREILELIPDALMVQSAGKVAYANKGALKMLRAEKESDLLGMDGLDILPEDQKHEILRLREKALEQKKSFSQRTRHKRLNGEVFHSEIYTTSIKWDGVQSTLNIIKDISRRHQYEEQLRKNEQEMLLAQNIGNFGHWRLDVAAQTITWSKALYDLHGLPHDMPISHEFSASMISEEDRIMMQGIMAEATNTGEIRHFEVPVTLPSSQEKRTMAGSLLAEFGPDGEVVSIFGVLEDVTERRAMEEQFRQSQKMEAIGQLTGGVAHDFNNLLAIILGNAELLSEALPENQPNITNHLQSIIRATTRGAELVNSMLAFSRSQQLRPERAYLSSSVAPLLDVLRRTIGENISIKTELDADVWPCVADVGQVENALLNLCLNARDAMPGGGELLIGITNCTLEETLSTPIEDIPEGHYIKLTVQDTGTGIPAEKLKRVFDPFFTTKDVGKGTGLGLSMVYGFIRQSNGFVNIQSALDSGTMVELYLPRDYSEVSALEI